MIKCNNATNSNIKTENRFSFSGDNFYLKSYEEMASTFDESWLKNTLHVSEMVDVNLSFGDLYFPNYPIEYRKRYYSIQSFLFHQLFVNYTSVVESIVSRKEGVLT